MSRRAGFPEYFHRDPDYGLSDRDAVVPYVRALMEDSEVPWCFDYARRRVLADESLLSVTLVSHLGLMQDERGASIIRDKLEQAAIGSARTGAIRSFVSICLEALARIGGEEVRRILESIRHDPDRAHLHEEIDRLVVADRSRSCVASTQADLPPVLRGIHSLNDVVRVDDAVAYGTELPDVVKGSDAERKILAGDEGPPRYGPARAKAILEAVRSLRFPDTIETLSGDGHTTTFELSTPITDHVHDLCDPFTDFGIDRSDPKIEYPPGRRRWALSHTFLFYPVPDGSLYGKQYTWDLERNTFTTHFHRHVACERVALNQDGRSVTVTNTPIATSLELRGNTHTLRCNSAVRGVWDNPQREGRNYYARRAEVLVPYRRLCYFQPLHETAINQLGIWLVDESEDLASYFDGEGTCVDREGVVTDLLIPLHEPKVLAWSDARYEGSGPRDLFCRRLPQSLWPELTPVPSPSRLDPWLEVTFDPDACGHAGWQGGADNGYRNGYDLNGDGRIDVRDREILERHQREVYRQNLADLSYFGLNWLSTGYGSRSRNFDEQPPLFVCAYDYGGGYDPSTGRIQLLDSPTESADLFVEYFHDAPAEEGRDNIRVFLHDPVQ